MAKKAVSKQSTVSASGSSHTKAPLPSNISAPSTSTSTTSSTSASTTSTAINSKDSSGNVLVKLINSYFETAPGRVRLIDAFMAFLVALGVYQFLVVLVIGTFVSTCSFAL